MKLAEIKLGLIEQHFSSNSNGIKGEALNLILEQLGQSLNIDTSAKKLSTLQESRSNEPSKAFKKFTEGDCSMMSIIDDEDGTPSTLFVAVRTGKTVKIANLTTDPINEKISDLKTVREALKQAKNFNEDIIFETAVISDRLSIHKLYQIKRT